MHTFDTKNGQKYLYSFDRFFLLFLSLFPGEEHRHHHGHDHHDEGSVSGGAPGYMAGGPPPPPGSPEFVEISNNNNEEDEGAMVDMPCPHSEEEEDLAEDTFFTGALGFGVMGDMCMYQNFDTLSLPCQSTITDLHELREQVGILYYNIT